MIGVRITDGVDTQQATVPEAAEPHLLEWIEGMVGREEGETDAAMVFRWLKNEWRRGAHHVRKRKAADAVTEEEVLP